MIRLLYVAGVGFSGSTLLALLLDAHPEIVSPGELTGPVASGPEPYRCSCGAPLAACAFWTRVAREMAVRGQRLDPERWDTRFDLGRGRLARQLLSRSLRSNAADDLRDAVMARLPGTRARLAALLARNRALLESLREAGGARVVADASKHPARARYLARLPEVDLRVVHLVRDAPGLVCSRMRNQGFSLASSVRFWNRGAGHAERLRRALPAGRWLRVHYEALCAGSERELDRIAAFAGLGPFPRPVRLEPGAHHVIGNRMRLSDAREIRLDTRWREALSPAQVAAVLRGTRRARARLGYGEEPGVVASGPG